MGKKLTLEEVKSVIESIDGYKLLSKEYINTRTKLKIQCDKGHIFEMRFDSFKYGQKCPECGGTKKLTFQYIKEYIESIVGYKLLSTKYINTRTKLKIQCDKGHIFEIYFSTFKQGHRCHRCFYENRKHSFNFIKEYIESIDGYKLLSTKYINVSTKLKIRCNKGHIYKVEFGNFQRGIRCPICWAESTSSKGEKEILDYIKSNYSGKIIENDRNTILNPLTNHYLELDIYLPELKKAIEYNGDYWHSLPTAIKNDKIKINQCKKLGIDLLIIEENKWKNDRDNCYNKIKKYYQV